VRAGWFLRGLKPGDNLVGDGLFLTAVKISRTGIQAVSVRICCQETVAVDDCNSPARVRS